MSLARNTVWRRFRVETDVFVARELKETLAESLRRADVEELLALARRGVDSDQLAALRVLAYLASIKAPIGTRGRTNQVQRRVAWAFTRAARGVWAPPRPASRTQGVPEYQRGVRRISRVARHGPRTLGPVCSRSVQRKGQREDGDAMAPRRRGAAIRKSLGQARGASTSPGAGRSRAPVVHERTPARQGPGFGRAVTQVADRETWNGPFEIDPRILEGARQGAYPANGCPTPSRQAEHGGSD